MRKWLIAVLVAGVGVFSSAGVAYFYKAHLEDKISQRLDLINEKTRNFSRIDADVSVNIFKGTVLFKNVALYTSKSNLRGSIELSGVNFFSSERPLSDEIGAKFIVDYAFAGGRVLDSSWIVSLDLTRKEDKIDTKLNYGVISKSNPAHAAAIVIDLDFTSAPDLMGLISALLESDGEPVFLTPDMVEKYAQTQLSSFSLAIDDAGYFKDAWVSQITQVKEDAPFVADDEAVMIIRQQLDAFSAAVNDEGLKTKLSDLLFEGKGIKASGRLTREATLFDLYLLANGGLDVEALKGLYEMKVYD
jgi:hypothetical protein